MKRIRAPTRERQITTSQQSLNNSFKSMANGFMNFSNNDEFQSVMDNELIRQDSDTSFYSIEDETCHLDDIQQNDFQFNEQIDDSQEQQEKTKKVCNPISKKKNSQVFELELQEQPKKQLKEENIYIENIQSNEIQPSQYEIYQKRARQPSDYNNLAQPAPVVLKISDYYGYTSPSFKTRFQRIQLIKNFQSLFNFKKRKLISQINLNITSLIIYLLNQKNIYKVMLLINIIIDATFRGLYIMFIIQVALEDQNEFLPLLFFLLIPRFLVTIIIIKLIYLDQYSVDNFYIRPLSYLFRSNFTIHSSYLMDEYPPQSDDNRYIFSLRLAFYFIMPLEISFLALITFNHQQQNSAFNTYIISLYILKGIEAICFQPLLLSFLWLNYFQLNYESTQFQLISSYLILFDIAKYFTVNIFLFFMGNASLQLKRRQRLASQQIKKN